MTPLTAIECPACGEVTLAPVGFIRDVYPGGDPENVYTVGIEYECPCGHIESILHSDRRAAS